MVDNLESVAYSEKYNVLLARAMTVLESLAALYAPEAQAGNTYAIRCANESVNRRQITSDYLLPAGHRLSVEITSTFNVSLLHYLDEHWADYALYPPGNKEEIGYPVYAPIKHEEVVRLHAELKAVMHGIGEITNALSLKEQKLS